jgi:hypothetical protein
MTVGGIGLMAKVTYEAYNQITELPKVEDPEEAENEDRTISFYCTIEYPRVEATQSPRTVKMQL